MRKFLTVFSTLLLTVGIAFADGPFRNHRYDAFKVLPVTSDDIVFIGNSITNMHEWWEAFGNHNIKSRGVSGAVTQEGLDNIEAIAAGKPKKVFIMLGTNDLGTAGINNAEHVKTNVKLIIERFRQTSPDAKVYIQSILPSGSRDMNLQQETNTALKALCDGENVIYIDLWDKLIGVATNANGLSYDRLHLTAAAYKIWCDAIAPYVMDKADAVSVYPANAAQLQKDGGLGGAYGMRATVFSLLPVDSDDILLVGDEMIHGGEWHELLQSARVKNRGTAWGYPGPSLSQLLSSIPTILHDGAKPAQVLLYAGVSDVNGTTDLSTVLANYKSIVSKILSLSPDTKVTIMSLQPTSVAATNTNRVKPFNQMLAEYAAENSSDNIEYVDIYTDFVTTAGVANTNYFSGNYLYGKGYAKLAQLLAEAIGEDDIVAISEEVANDNYTRFTNRTALGKAVATAALLPEGNGVGLYPTEGLAPVKSAISAAYAALAASVTASDAFTDEISALTSATNEVRSTIVMPTYSTPENEVWYQLYTPNRGERYLTSNGVGMGVSGEAANNYTLTMWKFVDRGNGTVDIVNRKDGSYLNPVANYNTQISTMEQQSASGWTIEYSNSPGLFIIHSGTVQINQTQASNGYKVYNWSAGQTGTDRDDTGCQYKILEVTGDPDAEPEVPTDENFNNVVTKIGDLTEGWYQMRLLQGDATVDGYVSAGTNNVLNANSEYRQNASNYYPLKIGTYDAAKPATAWVYVKPIGNKYLLKSINGHAVLENCTASRDITQGYTTITMSYAGFSSVDHWSYWANGATESPYIGKISSSNNKYAFSRVTDAQLANYDIYTVVINGIANASEVGNDPSVTYTGSVAIGGISKVFNNGHFFFPKGTTPAAADFTIPAGNYELTVNVAAKTLTVDVAKLPGEGEGSTGDGEYTVSTSTGLLYRDGTTTGQNWNNKWVFTTTSELSVALTLTSNANNMTNSNGTLQIFGGAVGTSTYTLQVPAGYMITGYSFDHVKAGSNDVTIQVGDKSYTSTATSGNITVTGISSGTTSFVLTGGNNGVSLSNFKVQVERDYYGTAIDLGVTATGIGATDVPLLRFAFNIDASKASTIFSGVKGSLGATDVVEKVYVYSVADVFEYRPGKEDAVLLGEAIPAADGTFSVEFDEAVTLASGESLKYWLVADISDEANEGDIIDAAITAYTMDEEELPESGGNPDFSATVFITASTVEYLNTYDSRYYRIPSITTAMNGWLVAVTDKRFNSNNDLPNNIDVVARVSKDNGATWSEPVTIAGTGLLGGEYGHGDPAIVTDRVTGDIIVLVTSKVGFFYGTPTNPPLLKCIVSHDNGETWDAPVDITSQIYGSTCEDETRKEWYSMFFSSGTFLQTSKGTLMCVVPVRTTSSTTHSEFEAHIVRSDDHGKTWTCKAIPALTDADESKIVELNDGRLLVKSRHAGKVYYAISDNDGETWTPRATWNELDEPGCNGDIIRLTSESKEEGANRLLLSIPNAGSRRNVTVFLSTDEAQTWPVKKTICPRGSAYSSMTVLEDGTIGFYYEEDGLEGGYQMRYVRFSLDWLTNNTDKIDADKFAAARLKEAQALAAKLPEISSAVGEDASNVKVGYYAVKYNLTPEIKNTLESVVTSSDLQTIQDALTLYMGTYSSELVMPQDGKVYRIKSVIDSSVEGYEDHYIANAENMFPTVGDDETTLWVCQQSADDNSRTFVSVVGDKYFGWKGLSKTSAVNYRLDRGNSDGRFGLWNPNAESGTNVVGRYLALVNEYNNSAAGTAAVSFNQSTVIVQNGTWSSEFMFEEVSDDEYAGYLATVSKGANGNFGTLNLPFAVYMPEGVVAESVSYNADESAEAISESVLQLAGGILPANTPVLLKSDASGEYTFTPAPALGTSAVETGLKGTLAAATVADVNAYTLACDGEEDGEIRFYLLDSSNNRVDANKAYLVLSGDGNVTSLKIGKDETTAIDSVKGVSGDTMVIYDLTGRRLDAITAPGVYVINGKKCVVK